MKVAMIGSRMYENTRKVKDALFQRFCALIGLYLSINYYSLYN